MRAKKLGFESFAAMRDEVNRVILTWVPRVMFVLMPLFALFVALAYRQVERNYLHHLIFALHVHAAWFAAGTVVKAVEIGAPGIGPALEPLVVVFGVAYVILAFRRVYGKVRLSFARIAFVLIAYFVTYVAAFAAMIIPMVFRQVMSRPT